MAAGEGGAGDEYGQQWEDSVGEALGAPAGESEGPGGDGGEGRREAAGGRQRHGQLRDLSSEHLSQP